MGKLFDDIVSGKKLNSSFTTVKNKIAYEPARRMLEEIYSRFENIDGNFLQQFQTTGFDQRIFELYLFAYFKDSGFEFERGYDRPDFIIKKDGNRVAVEATTVNPSKKYGNINRDLSGEDIRKRLEHELPIRFGSPLFTKLKKKYWELEHCKDTPLILAIQSFHEKDSLEFSGSSLINYLYGTIDKVIDGSIVQEEVDKHLLNGKEIPSGFFKIPESDNVSAVIFSNSGSIAKFQRMGYNKGYSSSHLRIIREGTCYNYEPNAIKPEFFSYDLDETDYNEPWGDELIVCLNPNAKHPIPMDFFPNATQYYLHEGRIVADLHGFSPYASKTIILGYPDFDLPEKIERITRKEVNALVPERIVLPFFSEHEWYITSNKDYLGIIVLDLTDETFNVIILNHNKNKYKAVDSIIDFKNLQDAREALFRILSRNKK